MESIVQKQGAQGGSEVGEHLHLREEGGHTGITSAGEAGACEVREEGRTHSKTCSCAGPEEQSKHMSFSDFHKPLD